MRIRGTRKNTFEYMSCPVVNVNSVLSQETLTAPCSPSSTETPWQLSVFHSTSVQSVFQKIGWFQCPQVDPNCGPQTQWTYLDVQQCFSEIALVPSVTTSFLPQLRESRWISNSLHKLKEDGGTAQAGHQKPEQSVTVDWNWPEAETMKQEGRGQGTTFKRKT